MPNAIEQGIYDKDTRRRNNEGMIQYCTRRKNHFKELKKQGFDLPDLAKGYILMRDAKLTDKAPGFHIIDHVIYHTTFDIPELVPAEGMKRSTKAFIGMIEDVNELSLEELR